MHLIASPVAESRFRRHFRRAEMYLAANQREAAIKAFQAASEANQDHVETRLRMADLHLAADRHNPAREQVVRALSGHIESPRIAVQLIQRLNTIGESTIVLDVVRQLPTAMWDSATSLAEVAKQLVMIGAYEPADEFARAAVARDPDHPTALSVMATVDLFHGRLEHAYQHAERCLARLPDDPGSHWLIGRLRRPGGATRVDRIRAALSRTTEPGALATLGFALHDELHELRDYAGAWRALEDACGAKRRQLDYDPADTAALFGALHTFSPMEAAMRDGYRDPDIRPLFVIGLHRSGTTLVERIISGHSQVAAGGETYDITTTLRRASGVHCRNELDTRVVQARAGFDYRRIGAEYLQGMRWRIRGKQWVTDKLPSNFLNVGFIARALPDARFVCLQRDPIDVGLSSLRTLFGTGCGYSYDQMDYVDYYRRFDRLMDHWHALFPGRILDVRYDELVAEPEAMTRRIAEFCGLDFEPAMVKIEERSDAVSTASSVMMRDGIRKDRGKVWKAYEQQLQPMIQALGGG